MPSTAYIKTMDDKHISQHIHAAADDKKAFDVVELDVHKLSSVTDRVIIASGSSAPHLKALQQEICVRLKHEGNPVHRVSGTPESGWVVLDFIGVVVHLFTREVRQYYALEELWGDAPRVR